ncbi:MAG: zinc ABC transporter substrate-binding protein [Planctomycetota bacterium]
MTSYKAFLIGVLGAGIIMTMAPGCGGKAAAPSGNLDVFVSIPPQAYIAEQVGGPGVRVSVMVGPGQNPHTFALTPAQITGLANARVYFTIGLPFEKIIIDRIRQNNPGLMVIDSAAGITLRSMEEDGHADGEEGHGPGAEDADHHHAEGDADPHIWLDPVNAKMIATNMTAALKAADPAHAADYDTRLQSFNTAMDTLHAELAAALAPLQCRDFFVFHPAFGYFGDRYGLHQVAVETGGKEPSAKQLAALIDRARAAKVKVIFVQPQFPSRSAEAVAREIGGVVVPMDDLARDYPTNLRDMAAKIRAALGQ